MRIVINRWHMSVTYKVIAISVDNLEMEAEKATRSNKKRKYRNLSTDERIESKKTKYVGVSWNKRTQRWIANIKINGKSKHLGYFDSDYDAAMKYDEEARQHGKSVNVPIHPSDDQAEKQKKPRKLSDIERMERQETEYVGVSWSKQQQRWHAWIHYGKKKNYLGLFDTDYEAAMRYDEEARKQGKAVNFKFSDEDVQAEKQKKPRKLKGKERIERQETEYVGVSWNKDSQQWSSRIRINKHVKKLGYYDKAYDAAKRYDEEARKHGRPVNIPIHPTDVQAKKQKKSRKLIGMERIESQETKYVGVSWDKNAQRWGSSIQTEGKRNHLGLFDSDYDAAMRYDQEARKHGREVNFKFSDEEIQAERRKKPRKLSGMEQIERQETEYVGVSWSKQHQRWRVRIQIADKRKFLGLFDSDYEAAMKYDEEARNHGKPANFPIDPEEIQAEKPNKG